MKLKKNHGIVKKIELYIGLVMYTDLSASPKKSKIVNNATWMNNIINMGKIRAPLKYFLLSFKKLFKKYNPRKIASNKRVAV